MESPVRRLILIIVIGLLYSCSDHTFINYYYRGLEKVDSENLYVSIEVHKHHVEGKLGNLKEVHEKYYLITYTEDASIVSKVSISDQVDGDYLQLHSCTDSNALISISRSNKTFDNQYLFLLNIYSGQFQDLQEQYDSSKRYSLINDSSIAVSDSDSTVVYNKDFTQRNSFPYPYYAEPGFKTNSLLFCDDNLKIYGYNYEENSVENYEVKWTFTASSLVDITAGPINVRWLTTDMLTISVDGKTFIGNIVDNKYNPRPKVYPNAFPLQTKEGFITNYLDEIIYVLDDSVQTILPSPAALD